MKGRGERRLKLAIIPQTLAVCRLDKDDPIPEWASRGRFFSITRTSEELSAVCPQDQVPAEMKREEGWKGIKVKGPLDFSLTGILASLATPLAQEGISILAISTYDTDYLLVKERDLERAIEILSKAGNQIQRSRPG
ncbi:MAG TPA: ACT domain-containing protein [Thermodesulfobacteriota bacterium]|jgi:hypothetical protein|nr:ACT domain-containing protein [Thermodesulfobacteriota bacterium]